MDVFDIQIVSSLLVTLFEIFGNNFKQIYVWIFEVKNSWRKLMYVEVGHFLVVFQPLCGQFFSLSQENSNNKSDLHAKRVCCPSSSQQPNNLYNKKFELYRVVLWCWWWWIGCFSYLLWRLEIQLKVCAAAMYFTRMMMMTVLTTN